MPPVARLGTLVLVVGVVMGAAAAPPRRPVPVTPEPVLPGPPLSPVPRPGKSCARFDKKTTQRWAHVRGGWSGGDGVFSVALGRGRTLWLFGDSIVARQGQSHYAFVRNAAVEEMADGRLVTTAATREGRSTLGFADPPTERWLWPGTGFMANSQLWLFASEMRKTGPGFWGFEFRRSWLFRLALRRHRLVELQRTPMPADGIVWGAAVISSDDWLYIFGVHDRKTAKHPRIARAPRTDPLAPWSYWNGAEWVATQGDAARWRGSVASQYSVVPSGGGIALVSAGAMLDGSVSAYWAPAVVGPWTHLGLVFRPRLARGWFAYNALLHPLPNGDFELSYNIASTRPEASAAPDPRMMLPRFAHVPAACVTSLSPPSPAGSDAGR